MQLFYKFAPRILAVIGACVALITYFLDLTFRVNYGWVLWPGIFFAFATAGFLFGRLIKKLSLSSHTDFLTGLWNRRYFYLRLDEERARATRKNTAICVAMIDVDDFKMVNDTYGHAVGDLLLSELARIFKKKTRVTDIITRWGGDEFAILFSETSLENALEVMKRIRHEVEYKFSQYQMTISAGIITLEPDQKLKELLIEVDQALYKAKYHKNSVIA